MAIHSLASITAFSASVRRNGKPQPSVDQSQASLQFYSRIKAKQKLNPNPPRALAKPEENKQQPEGLGLRQLQKPPHREQKQVRRVTPTLLRIIQKELESVRNFLVRPTALMMIGKFQHLVNSSKAKPQTAMSKAKIKRTDTKSKTTKNQKSKTTKQVIFGGAGTVRSLGHLLFPFSHRRCDNTHPVKADVSIRLPSTSQ